MYGTCFFFLLFFFFSSSSWMSNGSSINLDNMAVRIRPGSVPSVSVLIGYVSTLFSNFSYCCVACALV